MKWLRLILITLVICLFVSLGSLAYAVEGQVAGTWCSICNRLIPAGQTCPHMRGGGYTAPSGPSAEEIAAKQRRQRAQAFNDEGLEYYNNHEWQSAVDDFTTALEQCPDDATIRSNLVNANEKLATEQQRAEQERKEKKEKEQNRKQEEFNRAKSDALNSMKGLSDSGLGLKGVGSSDDLGLKDMDDSGQQLKDAVTDSSAKTLFDKKGASRDLLSAHAHGITALDRAANILQGAATNPLLETSLEQAKAETDGRFSTPGKNAGQFNTVVLTDVSAPQQPSEKQPVHVPAEVAKDPRFQKLVVEREALDHQIEVAQQHLASIKADSSYAQSQTLLTEAYNQHNALESLKVMRAYDEKQITSMVHLEPVDFGEGSAPANPARNVDNITVPPPGH